MGSAASSDATPSNSNKEIATAAPAAQHNSLQERGSGGRGGFGRGGGGGWGGGGSYGPASYYYSPGSASSRFDFASMWSGGARRLQGAAGEARS
jgi:hypothetical protein